jgi:C4-type Zn-finger protein
LTSPNILKAEENQSRNRLSLEDEDIKEIDEQKLKNEDSKREKDHFTLIVKKVVTI